MFETIKKFHCRYIIFKSIALFKIIFYKKISSINNYQIYNEFYRLLIDKKQYRLSKNKRQFLLIDRFRFLLIYSKN